MYIVPASLIGAMWLQIGEEIGDKRPTANVSSGRWFKLHPDVARTNRLYCSPVRVAQRAYRVRANERQILP
jgi:hypothetical protein